MCTVVVLIVVVVVVIVAVFDIVGASRRKVVVVVAGDVFAAMLDFFLILVVFLAMLRTVLAVRDLYETYCCLLQRLLFDAVAENNDDTSNANSSCSLLSSF